MPKSQLIAKIKRMDVTNKIQRKNWKQMIGISLGEIALNDENLLAIRKFRPNEEVLVTITPMQRDMAEEMNRMKKANPVEGIISESKGLSDLPDNPLDLLIEDEPYMADGDGEDEDAEELLEITVLQDGEEETLADGEEVSKTFEF